LDFLKRVITRIGALTALLAFSFFCTARGADTIANWTFENYYQASSVTNTDSPTLLSAFGPSGSLAWGHHASASSKFYYVLGNGSSNALTADHWAIGDFFEFQTSTLGFTNILVSFDQYRSPTGPTNWAFTYSVDGTLFNTALAYSVTNSTDWSATTRRSAYTFTVDLATVTELSEAANVYFRLVADSAPGSTQGTSRVDNFAVLGTLVPEPPVSILIGTGTGFLLFARRRARQ
jgi:hypothetical protein